MTRTALQFSKSTLLWCYGLVPLLLLLGAWQILGDASSPFFPTPSEWFGQLKLSGTNGLLALVKSTLTVFTIGIIAAFILGFGSGLALGRSALLDSMFTPTLEFIRAVPAPVVVPLFILFLGPDRITLVASVVFAAIWPILLNSMESARAIEGVLVDSARTLRLTRFQRFVKVIGPSVLPGSLVGVRVALPIALVVTLLAEMLTGSHGLGGALMQAQRTYQTANAYGLLVVAGVVGVVVAAGFQLVQRVTLRSWTG